MTMAKQLAKEAILASHCPLARVLALQMHRRYERMRELDAARERRLKIFRLRQRRN